MSVVIYQRRSRQRPGGPLEQLAQISGRIELVIMREMLRINDVVPTEQAVDRLAAGLIRGYEDTRDDLATQG